MCSNDRTWGRFIGFLLAAAAGILIAKGPAWGQPDSKANSAASEKQIIRVRAGIESSFKDSKGNTWLGDRVTKDGGIEGGQTIGRANDLKIENTKDPELYRNEHYSMDSFSWKLPNGKYIVKLHFAETFDGIGGPGDRVFSFKVQDKEFKDFDVWKKAGGMQKAYVEKVPVEVTNGKLMITFTPKVENPEVNGIEIIPEEMATADDKPASSGSQAAASERPIIRVKAGVDQPLKDSKGNTWLADKMTKDGGFEGGETIDRPDIKIENTKDPDLYRAERYSMDSFWWKLPAGKYIVKLHFAETYDGIGGPGDRVFSFKVQDKEFKDFDVWKKAGGMQKAYIEKVPVEIKDGKLTITFTPNIQNPQINAIEIIPEEKAAADDKPAEKAAEKAAIK
jgi:hypothetical protein